MRFKAALFIFLAAGAISMQSCDLLPPECALEFSFDGVSQDDPSPGQITISYTMENIGYVDLNNCKLYFEIDDGSLYYRWCPGINLNTSQSYSGSFVPSLSGLSTPVSVQIVGTGWDDPAKE